MKAAFLSALILAVCEARPRLEDLQSYTFEMFLNEYEIDLLPESQEYNLRRQIFELEL